EPPAPALRSGAAGRAARMSRPPPHSRRGDPMIRSAVPSSSSAMRARAWLAAVLVLLAGVACQRAPVEAPMEADASAREQAAARLPLIPLPAETERRQGGFVVDASTRVVAAPGDAAAQQAARQFVAML